MSSSRGSVATRHAWSTSSPCLLLWLLRIDTVISGLTLHWSMFSCTIHSYRILCFLLASEKCCPVTYIHKHKSLMSLAWTVLSVWPKSSCLTFEALVFHYVKSCWYLIHGIIVRLKTSEKTNVRKLVRAYSDFVQWIVMAVAVLFDDRHSVSFEFFLYLPELNIQ